MIRSTQLFPQPDRMSSAAGTPGWLETQAVVTSCRFEFARMNTLTFGMGTNIRYIISFTYHAHGKDFKD